VHVVTLTATPANTSTETSTLTSVIQKMKELLILSVVIMGGKRSAPAWYFYRQAVLLKMNEQQVMEINGELPAYTAELSKKVVCILCWICKDTTIENCLKKVHNSSNALRQLFSRHGLDIKKIDEMIKTNEMSREVSDNTCPVKHAKTAMITSYLFAT
jgi:hypothetical protein